MKKTSIFLVVFFALLFCFGCYSMYNESRKINFVEIESCDINWNKIDFDIDLKSVIFLDEIKSIETKQDAITIGEAIIADCHETGRFVDYSLITIVHSRQDNVWRFDYSLNQSSKKTEDLIECGNFCVAVDGNAGELIKAWLEE